VEAKAAPVLRFDPGILNQLACPACRRDLRLDGLRLFCANCNKIYPIVDGVPVLIAERAQDPESNP